MGRFLAGLLFGLAIVLIGIAVKPHLIALGGFGPYVLVATMWVTIIGFMMLWRRPSLPAFLLNVMIASSICVPIVAYLINRWLGFAVGAAVLYLAFHWAGKLKDGALPSSDSQK